MAVVAGFFGGRTERIRVCVMFACRCAHAHETHARHTLRTGRQNRNEFIRISHCAGVRGTMRNSAGICKSVRRRRADKEPEPEMYTIMFRGGTEGGGGWKRRAGGLCESNVPLCVWRVNRRQL